VIAGSSTVLFTILRPLSEVLLLFIFTALHTHSEGQDLPSPYLKIPQEHGVEACLSVRPRISNYFIVQLNVWLLPCVIAMWLFLVRIFTQTLRVGGDGIATKKNGCQQLWTTFTSAATVKNWCPAGCLEVEKSKIVWSNYALLHWQQVLVVNRQVATLLSGIGERPRDIFSAITSWLG